MRRAPLLACALASVPLLVASSSAPLPFFYDLYTFRDDRGGTTVVPPRSSRNV